jgi:hypothetical protein
VEPHFFLHLSLDRQKDEHLCSFLEPVPKLVILSHSLQPVVLLLRPAAAAAEAVVVVPLLLFPQIRLQNR